MRAKRWISNLLFGCALLVLTLQCADRPAILGETPSQELVEAPAGPPVGSQIRLGRVVGSMDPVHSKSGDLMPARILELEGADPDPQRIVVYFAPGLPLPAAEDLVELRGELLFVSTPGPDDAPAYEGEALIVQWWAHAS